MTAPRMDDGPCLLEASAPDKVLISLSEDKEHQKGTAHGCLSANRHGVKKQ